MLCRFNTWVFAWAIDSRINCRIIYINKSQHALLNTILNTVQCTTVDQRFNHNVFSLKKRLLPNKEILGLNYLIKKTLFFRKSPRNGFFYQRHCKVI
jgi:hypothetical protein